MHILKKVLSNKVLLYVGSRYVVYGLQFISLIILASKLGPYNYGIWGFILMLISYLNILNLGIPNSINILVVQFKNSVTIIKNYIASSLVVVGLMIGFLGLIAACYTLWPESLFTKYSIGSKFYLILIIGALQYLNVLMVNIFRASNRLLEVAIYQSSIPIGVFTVTLLFKGSILISALVWTYIIMNLCSLLFFFIRGYNFFGGKPSVAYIKTITNKGIFLFLYNACFYLILTTTSTLVSNYFSVSEYGSYSFSYTLGHSILLLMEAFMYVIFPKVIDKFYVGDTTVVQQTLTSVRINYVSVAHGLIYCALAVFPFVIHLFPQFKGSLMTLNLMMLAIVLSTNAFGYNTFLMARNKERICSIISIVTLIVNICLGFFLIIECKIPYYLVVIAIMISYLLFAFLCSFVANKYLDYRLNLFQIFLSVMPLRLLVPYIVAIVISVIDKTFFAPIPLIIFSIFNKSTIIEILNTIKKVVYKPQIVDINK